VSGISHKGRRLFNSITNPKKAEILLKANGCSCLCSLLVSLIYYKSKVQSYIVSTVKNVYSLDMGSEILLLTYTVNINQVSRFLLTVDFRCNVSFEA